jgi:hypothetical protein
MRSGKARQQVLGTLVNEIPTKMREGDNRVRKLHEALVRLRVELRLNGCVFLAPDAVGRTSSSEALCCSGSGRVLVTAS